VSIKSGQILHQANDFVIDRLQTAGPGNLNIPEEKIYELGNYQTVATVRDIPELSFDMESLDVSVEIEALLTGQTEADISEGEEIDFLNAVPIDVISPFKASGNGFTIERGVIIPYLSLESCTYRFGVRQNATQSFTLRGDSIYYSPGAPYYEEFALTSGENEVYTLAETAIEYTEAGDTIYVLGACVKNAAGQYKRLFIGDDFSNTSGAITLFEDWDAEGYDVLHVVYGTAASITYSQGGNNPGGNVIHEGTSVKPAAVRGKDIDVYVSTGGATPELVRWTGVQSVELTRSVNLENDEELGNFHFVASDYDTAEVTGTINLKPVDPADLWEKIAQVAGVSTNVIAGPHSSQELELEIRVNDPDTGDTLKTLYVEDARFTLPSYSGQVQQKLEVPFAFSSDGGSLKVIKGARV